MFKFLGSAGLALILAVAMPALPVSANQLVNNVTKQIQRLDHRIEVPPLTPSQAGQLKVILDEPSRESSDFQKIQSVNAYLRTI